MTTGEVARPSGRGVTPVTAASRTIATRGRPGHRGPVPDPAAKPARGTRRVPIGGRVPRASSTAIRRPVRADRGDRAGPGGGRRSPDPTARVHAMTTTDHGARTTVRIDRPDLTIDRIDQPDLTTVAHDRPVRHRTDRPGRSVARGVRDQPPSGMVGSAGRIRRLGPDLARVAPGAAPRDPGVHHRVARSTVLPCRSRSLPAWGRTRSSWLAGDPWRSRSRRVDRRSGSWWCLTDVMRWSSSCCMPRRCASRSWRSKAAR